MLSHHRHIHTSVHPLSLCQSSYLWHLVDQQQRYGDGCDVMGAAHLQDVSQAHDGRVSGRDVPRAHVIVHTQVEDGVHLWQVGVPRDVKFTWGGRRGGTGGWAMWGTGATDGSSSSAASLIQTLPGKMLDGFLSMFLLLSSPPFFGISVSMDSQLVCKKTQNRMKCFTDTSFLSWEELQNDSLKHSGCGVARIWEQFKRAEEARSAFDFLTV